MNISKLMESEATNVSATKKHLGHSADLLHDIEKLYRRIPSLVKSPGGDIASSDEQLTFLTILHESRICDVLLTKAVLAAMRMYLADTVTHLRRAIECCAFATRMSKHHELTRVWAEGNLGDDTKYKAYRNAFTSRDVYPNPSHPDYDPILANLKQQFDLCSKQIHGSLLGMAGHFTTIPNKDTNATKQWQINYFDMPSDMFVSSFFHVLGTHCMILRLFAQIVQPYIMDLDAWREKYDREYRYVAEKIQRHLQQWLPNITALYEARNSGQRLPIGNFRPPTSGNDNTP